MVMLSEVKMVMLSEVEVGFRDCIEGLVLFLFLAASFEDFITSSGILITG